MLTKEEILQKLSIIKDKYKKDGIELIALFGSYAKDNYTPYSDIDIAYKIDYNTFSKKYKDGFSKLLKIEEKKENLKSIFKRDIDLVPYNKKFKESIDV